MTMTSLQFVRLAIAMAAMLLLAPTPALAANDEIETFVGTTTNMTPDQLELEIDILRWSSDADREAALSVVKAARRAPAAGDAAAETDAEPIDVEAMLRELPTLGYVWPSDSSVGYMVKYAHRTTAPDGTERITLVTGQPLGKYNRDPWVAEGGQPQPDAAFTVIELTLDESGTGRGTMSLAADVAVDDATQTVSLETSDTTPILLDGVTRQGA